MNEKILIKPFLKWVGGKGQLIKEIEKFYPFSNKINKYAEPFVGGGAVLFDILNKFELKEIYISDINKELINCYQTVRDNACDLIKLLFVLESEYHPKNDIERKKYFYKKREKFFFFFFYFLFFIIFLFFLFFYKNIKN